MAVFLPNKHFKQIYATTPPKGNFAIDKDPVFWDHCREQFAPKFTQDIKGFYFSHPADKGINIAEFLEKFEIVSGFHENSRFSRTNKPEVLWVMPSKLWLNCELKRSLLTIILRCGFNYNGENFDDALFSPRFDETLYVRDTKLAVMRFMFGFTFFTGTYKNTSNTIHKHGWREEFQNLEEPVIKKLLVRPIGANKDIPTVVGLESIWL